ncbi:MAG TPA: SRPBCC family protein [Polyangiaceae bacterium]|nr:SRPBCC family protein [Polyangiaceae bacterium]
MLKKILIGIGAVLALLVIVIAVQPSKFRVERSIDMAAPPEAAFAQVNDFHAWSKWSPWEKLDPNLKRSFDGPNAGVGAKYAWVGNDEVGEGRMTIEQSREPSQIRIKLEFLKPFAATNQTHFTFVKTPEGNKTTWAMEGESGFISKAFSLVMNMDELVGKDFEKGLAALKANAESAPKTPTAVSAAP